MMKFWNRRNKIEFFHSEASIIETFPIIESKDLKLNWVKKARQNFQDDIKSGAEQNPDFMHLMRCPGIFDLFKYGYIIPLHKDMIIKNKGGDYEYAFNKSENDSFSLGRQTSSSESLDQLLPIPPWAADRVFKINTGWHIIAPRGVKFLTIPIAYPDTFNFTSTMGILDPAKSTQLNFIIYLNETDEENTVILAGTPLGHLIPISEKKYQMIQRNMNQQDKRWIEKFMSAQVATFSSTSMRTKIINMYNQYWNR